MNQKGVIVTALAVLIATAGWFASAAAVRESGLRCRHSRSATGPPPAVVAVTPNGMLFHKPGCTYVHGPVRIEGGKAAIADGYTPCTRCLKF
jgi:hypothetical protein